MEKKYKKISIGIDESYARTGISIACDGVLKKVSSIDFADCKNKTEKRKLLAKVLKNILDNNVSKADKMIIICERIRMFSQGFVNINYLTSTGALIACIVDTAFDYNIKVFSVDTRSWKSQVVGTSKPNSKGQKQPTIEYIETLGIDVSYTKKGKKLYDDDAADSACIALYGFLPKERRNLKQEF